MHVVLSVEAVPDHLRGYISRFLQEAHTGLYVGVCSDRVADDLWSKIVAMSHRGQATMILSDPNVETGYRLRIHGSRRRRTADFDGVQLVVEQP